MDDTGESRPAELAALYQKERISCLGEGSTKARLNSWCTYLRKRCREGKLSDAQISKLNKTGFVWKALEAAREENFASLRAFRDKTDTAALQNETQKFCVALIACQCEKAHKDGRPLTKRETRLEPLGFYGLLRMRYGTSGMKTCKRFLQKINGKSCTAITFSRPDA